MTTLAIQLPDSHAERLRVMAQRLNVTPEELASAKVLDMLQGADDQFERAARYVLAKNAELYRRLA